MFNNIKAVFVMLLLFLSAAVSSNAEIALSGISADALSNPKEPFSQGSVLFPKTGSGTFSLLTCTTTTTGKNAFLSPTPDVFSVVDSAPCGSAPMDLGSCLSGTWVGPSLPPSGPGAICSWTDPTIVFAYGTFSYTGVDHYEPVIDTGCRTGFGSIATAPSVNAEAGSEIVRIVSFGVSFDQSRVESNAVEEGTFRVLVIEDTGPQFQAVFLKGASSAAAGAGPTGQYTVSLVEEIGQSDATAPWRACTIALRASSPNLNVPTMSEWGLGIFVALTGAASVWMLRKRSKASSRPA